MLQFFKTTDVGQTSGPPVAEDEEDAAGVGSAGPGGMGEERGGGEAGGGVGKGINSVFLFHFR